MDYPWSNALNNYDYSGYQSRTQDKKARMARTESTGNVVTPQYARTSWTGKRVLMVWQKGKMTPVDGRFVKCTIGKLEVNVLCHNTDRDPPKNYKLG